MGRLVWPLALVVTFFIGWTAAGVGLTSSNISALAASPDGAGGANLFAGTYGGGVFYAMEGTLPVQLVQFEAVRTDLGVELHWHTATEVNNYGFEIERRMVSSFKVQVSGDETSNLKPGTDWTRVGFIQGSGTTTSPRSYSFTDEKLAAGRYAYRIKQIDRDGSSAYFGNAEVEIPLPFDFALGQNYPNPFNPVTTISFSLPLKSFVSLKVFDALGREVSSLVSEELPAGTYSHEWNSAGFPSGVYFYRLQALQKEGEQASSFVETKKLVVLK